MIESPVEIQYSEADGWVHFTAHCRVCHWYRYGGKSPVRADHIDIRGAAIDRALRHARQFHPKQVKAWLDSVTLP